MSSPICKAPELREPKKKRVGPHIQPQQPFPIVIESENGIPAKSELWPLYTGHFTGDSVIVSNHEEMMALYTMGFFGKGSFSRSYPNFGLSKNGIPPIIKERQWQRRKKWMESAQSVHQQGSNEPETRVSETVTTSDQNDKNITEMDVDESMADKSQSSSGNIPSGDFCPKSDVATTGVGDEEENQNAYFNSEVLVLADSDEEDIEKVIRDPQPHLENESIKTAVETLNLTLEEAYFLSYGLGCLQVIDITGQPLKLKKLWEILCEAKSDFIESYTAYHHFRAKGWVVKTGFKCGGDFLLYKQGPPFYHASILVIVEKVNTKLERLKGCDNWTKVHGLIRLSEGSGKDLVFCQVVFPDDLTAEDLKTPKILKRIQINEVMVKRWVSSQKRDDDNIQE